MGIFDQRRKWRDLARVLGSAVEIELDRLGSKQAHIVADFIAHNEFGLAHDQLVDALSDLDLAPLEPTRKLLEQANSLMGHEAKS
ncbi:hypothetical protein [Sphingomonas colocasiae]|uniref:DUF3572 family protein n=1 Tax=Sphingomonas colocasiae TaxID=1848973 RepID=A0ABS7PUV7_9SPHN|nr:hypothetical protein [Sphingomonas colocasiae]MBY8825146.1 hypothetical protein [Sphingomonas colocasiae]